MKSIYRPHVVKMWRIWVYIKKSKKKQKIKCYISVYTYSIDQMLKDSGKDQSTVPTRFLTSPVSYHAHMHASCEYSVCLVDLLPQSTVPVKIPGATRQCCGLQRLVKNCCLQHPQQPLQGFMPPAG